MTKEIPNLKISKFDNPPLWKNKTLRCIKDFNCYTEDHRFVNQLIEIQKQHGQVTEKIHGHIVPWAFKKFKEETVNPESQPVSGRISSGLISQEPQKSTLEKGEYTVHFFVRFKKDKTEEKNWYNLQLILTEDKTGEIFFRYLDITPVESERSMMPIPPC